MAKLQSLARRWKQRRLAGFEISALRIDIKWAAEMCQDTAALQAALKILEDSLR